VIFQTRIIIPRNRRKKGVHPKWKGEIKRFLRRSDRKWEEEVQKRSASQAEVSDPGLARWDEDRGIDG